ncbi:DNA polymerase [Ralstonia phage RSJ5]|uniref:DNA polymerase n=1 Tax=Ralstonia phage RSJ5 TaxID=1538364 RepID=A0A077KTE0_9CAUD|nr:DNA polymerase [Ralstonia phage RSJ5]BAP34911.1 putative DNA polymerase [Ralstonia phage RSJ5]
MTFATFDLETTTAAYMKRKASPFWPGNWIVAAGYAMGDGPVEGLYFAKDEKKPFDWFTRMLKGTKLLAGQNIKFDLLYALREPQNLEAWMEWVANGGNVWDCQLAEYLLRGMEPSSHMLSMDEMAPIYGGNVKIDEVKALWEAGVDTPDIDPELLMSYLCGNGKDEGDIGNTRLIFKGQLAKARERGQLKSILLNMGSLIATVEMERNGMFVNKAKGLEQAVQLRATLEILLTELRNYLPDELPFDFNWRNRYHLSPLVFGGKVKYQKRVHVLSDEGELTYFQKEETHVLLSDGTTVRVDDLDALLHEPVRFAGGKNKGEVKTRKVKVPDVERGPKMRWEDCYHEFPGYTEPKDAWKSSTEGLWSVSADVIEELGNRNLPFLKTLAKVQEVGKDLSTYYITVDEDGKEKGMLTLVGLDSIIHHRINHTSTVTARFSSSDPNLQNVSKGSIDSEGNVTGSLIKTVFESRFGADGVIVQSDFTALEVYVQANLTACINLIEDLRAGVDMHCMRVSQKEGIPYEEALRLCVTGEGVDADTHKKWKKKRTEAKVFSFQRAYGAGAQKISDSTGMALEDVEALIVAENARYPEIEAYNKAKEERVMKSRRPTGRVEPHPERPGLMVQLGKGWSTTPDGKVYSYRESPSPLWAIKQGKSPASFSPTELKNYEVQGMGGEWAKAAMWLAVREFYRNKNWGGKALLVNQVHDALYADMHKEVHHDASAVLHACMLAASDFMEFWFGWEVQVPVPSVTAYGSSMFEEIIYGEDNVELADAYRIDIRNRYMNGYTPSYTIH